MFTNTVVSGAHDHVVVHGGFVSAEDLASVLARIGSGQCPQDGKLLQPLRRSSPLLSCMVDDLDLEAVYRREEAEGNMELGDTWLVPSRRAHSRELSHP